MKNVYFDYDALQDMDFTGADLTGAHFFNASLDGVNFTNATLENVDFNHVNYGFESLEFVGAHMKNVKFYGESLEYMDFTGADLTGAHFYNNAALQGSNFTNATLEGVDFTNSRLSAFQLAAKFVGADLKNAKFDRLYLQGVDFKGADLTGASFKGAHLEQRGDQPAARLENATLDKVDFSGATLTGVEFNEVKAVNAKFNDVDLNGNRFKNAILSGADFTGAKLHGVDMSNATLIDAKFIAATLDESSENPTTLKCSYLGGADFSKVSSMSGVNFEYAVVPTPEYCTIEKNSTYNCGTSTYLKGKGGISKIYGITKLPGGELHGTHLTCPDGSSGYNNRCGSEDLSLDSIHWKTSKYQCAVPPRIRWSPTKSSQPQSPTILMNHKLEACLQKTAPNGGLTDDYIGALRGIRCPNQGIESKGLDEDLKQFESLQVLDLSENKLSGTLTLSPKNKYLKELNVEGNALTQLELQNVTGGSNQLALISLNASHNQLKTIDISVNNAIASLDVSGNQLTSFDLLNLESVNIADFSDNPNLSSLGAKIVTLPVYLYRLYVTGDKIKCLDLLKNPNPDPNYPNLQQHTISQSGCVVKQKQK